MNKIILGLCFATIVLPAHSSLKYNSPSPLRNSVMVNVGNYGDIVFNGESPISVEVFSVSGNSSFMLIKGQNVPVGEYIVHVKYSDAYQVEKLKVGVGNNYITKNVKEADKNKVLPKSANIISIEESMTGKLKIKYEAAKDDVERKKSGKDFREEQVFVNAVPLNATVYVKSEESQKYKKYIAGMKLPIGPIFIKANHPDYHPKEVKAFLSKKGRGKAFVVIMNKKQESNI